MAYRPDKNLINSEIFNNDSYEENVPELNIKINSDIHKLVNNCRDKINLNKKEENIDYKIQIENLSKKCKFKLPDFTNAHKLYNFLTKKIEEYYELNENLELKQEKYIQDVKKQQKQIRSMYEKEEILKLKLDNEQEANMNHSNKIKDLEIDNSRYRIQISNFEREINQIKSDLELKSKNKADADRKYEELSRRQLEVNAEFELNLKKSEDNMQIKIKQFKDDNEINRNTYQKEME